MILIDAEKCDQCGTCIAVCPSDALVLTDVLRCDADACTQCGNCVRVCPFEALALSNDAAG